MKRMLGGWLCRMAALSGWRRWTALAAAAVVFLVSVLLLCGRTDYREDPSALAPRSADLYAEARDLPGFLATAGAWRLWSATAPGTLEKELAASVAARAGGLPVAPVLRWMNGAGAAAWCVSRGGGDVSSSAASWALFLHVENPADALEDMEVEPGASLEVVRGARGEDGVFALLRSGAAAGASSGAVFGIVGPWLILSGDTKLPEFALEAKGRPSVSLARADLLPDWRRGEGIRGMVNPSASADAKRVLGGGVAAERLAPEARLAFTALMGRSGGIETQVRTVLFEEDAGGAGAWPLVYILLLVIAAGSLGCIVCILLVMIGFGGWFKAAAVRAGVAPAKEPAAVEVSEAFAEDAGEVSATVLPDAKE